MGTVSFIQLAAHTPSMPCESMVLWLGVSKAFGAFYGATRGMLEETIPLSMKEIVLNVRVIPNSSQNSISNREDGTIKIKLTCAPVDGKANKALITLLSKEYGVPKSHIEIVKGKTSKNKVVTIKKSRQ